jgi:hypothetical protein
LLCFGAGNELDDRVARLERPRGRASCDLRHEADVVGQYVAQRGIVTIVYCGGVAREQIR